MKTNSANSKLNRSHQIESSTKALRSSSLRPLERTFAPCIIITNDKDSDKHKHLDQSKRCEREIIAHKYNCPGQQKNRLDVEDQKQHSDDVISHGKAVVSLGNGINPALVGPHLRF